MEQNISMMNLLNFKMFPFSAILYFIFSHFVDPDYEVTV